MPAMSEAEPPSTFQEVRVLEERLESIAYATLRAGLTLVRDPVSGTGPIMSVFREVG